jgi:hypothetical protein
VAAILRPLRRRILTPNKSEARLDVRGFHVKDNQSRDLLESIGGFFLDGYGYAAEARDAADAEERLEGVPPQFRGFAYEGAAMGFTVVDGVCGGRRLSYFLTGRAQQHIYMAYIGIGWAMARLPRFRWPKIQFDPVLRWLVLDGYGFHQAYFRTEKYVHQRLQDPRFPWPPGGPQSYVGRAIDQGIGRALWFVGGSDVGEVTDLIDKFPESRRSDLYSGAGLAATYAGGADEHELRTFWERAGVHQPRVAQGCAFAAEAIRYAGVEAPHAETAARVFWNAPLAEAARVCVDSRPDSTASVDHSVDLSGDLSGDPPRDPPSYETWRCRIADQFVSKGRA